MKEFCNILMAKDCIILDTAEDKHPDALLDLGAVI